MMSVSERVEEIKRRFDLSNAELGKVAGVSRQAVNGWLKAGATPSALSAIHLRERLGVSDKWLITGKGDMLVSTARDAFSLEVEELSYHLGAGAKDAILASAREFARQNSEQEAK